MDFLKLHRVDIVDKYFLPGDLSGAVESSLALIARDFPHARQIVSAFRYYLGSHPVRVGIIKANQHKPLRLRIVAESIGGVGEISGTMILIDNLG